VLQTGQFLTQVGPSKSSDGAGPPHVCASFHEQIFKVNFRAGEIRLPEENKGMKKKLLLCVVLALLCGMAAVAQDAKPQPLTFWYEYTINPGKEAQFMELVKTVGAPVRDKLMADGVIGAWGVETPMLREPGGATHIVWYSVSDWSGVEKVDAAMRAQIAKLDEEGKGGAGTGKKGGGGGTGVTARMAEIAVSMFAYAVMTMTGMSSRRETSCLHSSTPLMPAMFTSVMTRP